MSTIIRFGCLNGNILKLLRICSIIHKQYNRLFNEDFNNYFNSTIILILKYLIK